MNGLKKLRQTLRRNGNKSRSNNKPLNEVYIYTPLPNHKNGYIIEFRHSDSSEIYYYKYKEIAGGTLTKYGYLVCDHYIRNYDNSKYNKNDFSEEIDYKTLFSVNSDDKECIFYQTVADKEQIALEKRWMNELREKGKLHISAYDDDGEWSTLMQHNNDFIISDNIQRRRLDEILNKIDLNNNDIPTRTLPPLSIHQLSNNNNSSVKENVENVENYNNYYEFYTPPLSPKTPPSSPTENFANITQKSLLNMNIRQRDKNKGKKYQEEQQQPKEKVKKLIHLTQPKFRKTPMVYTYDPEDALEYKDCRCDYCLIDDYYE
ncbi:hypothetical protein RhiirA5_371322 [Rhizophagus irregularis]|uniref:Uncharacterized protein n=3 Tax=Rhizophagus irregularis TaxID=588596 RepID=A0A2N0SGJ6_9GLOM|nr:hypothetical protein RirG_090380 [Rhizophagus irregularis DAOM 197198w]PKC14613.1 hypothetical protein RhiirA5_371322 [Rhizophagus irregularis]GBC47496.1 hypothetical protein GLOIN_2v1575093 [Rhizophagus irregularis DAOM 181602=DAOM 197198]PKC74674.1 hypothetical protein RhiirA1_511228 [Rhizophagus irregularis]UZO10366.1 hypothetical protein OCT59_001955 [Rhizophagus irregularis]